MFYFSCKNTFCFRGKKWYKNEFFRLKIIGFLSIFIIEKTDIFMLKHLVFEIFVSQSRLAN